MLRRFTAITFLMILAVPSAMASPPDSFVDKVIAAESGGNPQARPRDPVTGKRLSSAYGAGQFIEATWLAMVRKYRPDLAARSEGDILEMRSDFALSREMTVRYAEENRAYLLNAGLKPTNAALYLAHFAGARGAVKMLNAHRDTLVDDILSRKAIEANGFLVGKTVAMLHAWAEAKMNIKAGATSNQVALASIYEVSTPDSTVEATRGEAKTSAEVRFILGGVIQVATAN